MIKDKILLGVFVGILADAVKLIVNFTAFLLNLTPVVFWQITATRFLEKNALYKPIAYVIGGVADLTVSALFGIVFVYFIYFIGSRDLWIKGIGFGLAIWVAVFGTLLGQTVQQKLPQTPTGIVVTMVAHFFFGAALAFFAWFIERRAEHEENGTNEIRYKFSPQPSRKRIKIKRD